MKKTLIVANWKEYKNISEARGWVEVFNKEVNQESRIKNEGGVEVVVCPPFVLIPVLHSRLLPLASYLSLGAQNVSKFEEGQYTGEVSAKMLSDFVKYVIVGHSERRKYFGETGGDVNLKIEQCLKHDLTPIVCVSSTQELSSFPSELSSGQSVVLAYEPLFAIGAGTPDTSENANDFAKEIKAIVGQDVPVLYGGSVNAKNAKSFVSQPDIDGVLVGQASLDATEFARIVDDCHSKR